MGNSAFENYLMALGATVVAGACYFTFEKPVKNLYRKMHFRFLRPKKVLCPNCNTLIEM